MHQFQRDRDVVKRAVREYHDEYGFTDDDPGWTACRKAVEYALNRDLSEPAFFEVLETVDFIARLDRHDMALDVLRSDPDYDALWTAAMDEAHDNLDHDVSLLLDRRYVH